MPLDLTYDYPQISDPKSILLLGCEFYGNPFHSAKEWSYENEIGKLWQRFMQLAKKYTFLFSSDEQTKPVAYEIHIEPDEYPITKQYYVFVGYEIKTIFEVPLEFVIKILPTVSYAEFTTLSQDHKKAEDIFQRWLDSDTSSYTQTFPYVILRYGAKYLGFEHADSEIDWMIPVKKR